MWQSSQLGEARRHSQLAGSAVLVRRQSLQLGIARPLACLGSPQRLSCIAALHQHAGVPCGHVLEAASHVRVVPACERGVDGAGRGMSAGGGGHGRASRQHARTLLRSSSTCRLRLVWGSTCVGLCWMGGADVVWGGPGRCCVCPLALRAATRAWCPPAPAATWPPDLLRRPWQPPSAHPGWVAPGTPTPGITPRQHPRAGR